MNWYIVQAYSGFEKKVVDMIKDELKKHKLEDNIGEILVPTHHVTEVKKGKRTKKEKKYFPGYVLVKIELTKQIYHLIKNLQKCSNLEFIFNCREFDAVEAKVDAMEHSVRKWENNKFSVTELQSQEFGQIAILRLPQGARMRRQQMMMHYEIPKDSIE